MITPGRIRLATRVVWIGGGSVFTALLLVVGTFQVVSALAHEERTTEATYDAAQVRAIEVSTDHGTIEVVGTTGSTVTVRSRISDGIVETEHRQEVIGDRLVIDDDCTPLAGLFCRADHFVEVPTGTEVDVRTRTGAISLTDLRGSVRAQTDNDRISADRLSGTVDLRTSNGRIQGTNLSALLVEASTGNGGVLLSFSAAPTDVRVTTGNGGVEIVVPDTPEAYRVDLSAGRGGTDSPIRTDPASPRLISGRAGNGSVSVRYPAG